MTAKPSETTKWDQRYATEAYVFGTQPSQFIVAQQQWLLPGQRALAVADGEGRNSVFMAEKGVKLTAMDSSKTGIAKAQKLAESRSVSVDFRHEDIRQWKWEAATYDLVVAIFIQFAEPELRSTIFEGILHTLKPGGILLVHGYTPRQLNYGTGGPPFVEFLYTRELLATAFKAMEILRLEEYDKVLEEGSGHSGMSALIDLVARKPTNMP